ncbi:MAG: hypothetical protein JSU90_12900 [Nitrospiraceae bacterium]|nr:MAG: hypothetical protein JSU90_12900 [Nitrospiraceae bacterium]
MLEGIDRLDVWRWASSLILAVLLFIPVKRLIFVQKVRRAEGKLKRQVTEDERKEIERRTIPITAFIVILFSFLFNSMIMSKYFRF